MVAVERLMVQLEEGNYGLQGVSSSLLEPWVVSSMLQVWGRALEEPFLPFACFEQAQAIGRAAHQPGGFSLQHSAGDRQRMHAITNALPLVNAKSLLTLTMFLHRLLTLTHSMPASSSSAAAPSALSWGQCFAPVLVRSADASAEVSSAATKQYAARFVELLISHSRECFADPDGRIFAAADNVVQILFTSQEESEPVAGSESAATAAPAAAATRLAAAAAAASASCSPVQAPPPKPAPGSSPVVARSPASSPASWSAAASPSPSVSASPPMRAPSNGSASGSPPAVPMKQRAAAASPAASSAAAKAAAEAAQREAALMTATAAAAARARMSAADAAVATSPLAAAGDDYELSPPAPLVVISELSTVDLTSASNPRGEASAIPRWQAGWQPNTSLTRDKQLAAVEQHLLRSIVAGDVLTLYDAMTGQQTRNIFMVYRVTPASGIGGAPVVPAQLSPLSPAENRYGALYWSLPSATGAPTPLVTPAPQRALRLLDIKKLVEGKNHSESATWSKGEAAARADPACCFSLLSKHGSLDLEAPTPRHKVEWIFAIRCIMGAIGRGPKALLMPLLLVAPAAK